MMMHTLDISQSIKPKFSNFNLFLCIPGMPLGPNFSILGMILYLDITARMRLGHSQNQNRRRHKGMRKIRKESRKEIKNGTDFKKTCFGTLDISKV